MYLREFQRLGRVRRENSKEPVLVIDFAAADTDYALLKAEGHSAQMAAQIVLDAKRGIEYAVRWIAVLRTKYEKA